MPRTIAALAATALVCCCTGAWVRAAPQASADGKAGQANASPKQADTPAAGHSLHGEAFDQGPRQAAYLMGGTGKISLSITTRVPKVQEFFNQGVGQLHGFWYFEAERSFRQAAALDPDCAMLYWGMAMANTNNAKRARGFIDEAAKRKAKASPRERLWIESLYEYYHPAKGKEGDAQVRRQYVRRLEAIIHEYDELEAKAFLAGKIWENSSHGIAIDSHEAVDSLIREVLAAHPNHPVHHYRIHLWDDEKASRALKAAALCGPAAPSIAHMWHMPGHTYSKLARYADAAWQQEASSRVDHAYMMHDFVLPDQIHNYAHNEEWLIRDLVFLGRAHDAIELAKCLIELPRHPRYNTLAAGGKNSASWGRTRLIEVLDRYELWAQAVELDRAGYLESLEDPAGESRRLQLLGAAAFHLGDEARGRQHIAELEGLIATAKKTAAAKQAAGKAAAKDGKTTAAADKRPARDAKGRNNQLKTLERALAVLRAHEALARDDAKVAIAQLEQGQTKDRELLSRAYLAAGNKAKAEELARAAFEAGKNQFYPLANYIDILWRLDRKSDACKRFDQLRTLGSGADLQLPVCKRLAPIAAERGLSGNWRLAAATPEDIGTRPDLNTLGPFRWQPPMAPPWEATDSSGKRIESTHYRGRPVLVVFYLGFGCLHCVEQLKAFSPLAEDFRRAGIEIVAIGTDTVQDLADMTSPASLKSKKAPEIRFPLLSDSGLEMFHRFRAYDDFEKQPLHGVFLVDATGRLRWQDINYEPFTDAAFVLKEAQRLLSGGNAPAARGEPPNRKHQK